ncbi:autotransporter outer membrane beta-barrel domain-containing protein [uncultured Bartonella sp.]|uniref:autotransporter outer membrane beta-barrel domain-containing protein n=1 Tax=uncultured Bartonella sp. TaxID=104108 RepID=UPI0025D75713|nr:autotransporter outer membrane beta-barrel domain-containing protein [uncultured Bartonella sp.]
MIRFHTRKKKYAPFSYKAIIFCGATSFSFCFSTFPLYATSVCNVGSDWSGGDAAIDNTCTVTSETFNPQTSDHYVGAALVSGAGNKLDIKGDLSSLAQGKRGVSEELHRLGDLDSSTNGQTHLSMGAKNEITTITDAGGQVSTVNVYPDHSFEVSDWGDAKYLTPEQVDDNQYISAGFGKAENGGELTVNLEDFRGNGFLDPKKTVYLALKNSNLTWADGEGSVVNWASKNSFESRAFTLNKDAIVREISVPVFPHSFTGYDGTTRVIKNVEELKAYNRELVNALQDQRFPNLKTQQAYDNAFAAAQPEFKSLPITSLGSTIPEHDKIFEDQGNTRAMYASNGGKIVVTSTGQIDVSFDPSEKSGALVAEGGSEVLIEKGGIVSARGNSAVILGSNRDPDDDNSTHTTGNNFGVINSGFRESVVRDTNINNSQNDKEFYSGSAVEAFFGGTFHNEGIINVAVSRSNEQSVAYSNGIYLHSVAIATNDGIINVGVNNDGLPGKVAGVAIDSLYSIFTNNSSGTIYIGRAAQYSNTDIVSDTTNANNTQFYGIMASSNATATNNGSIIIGKNMQNAAAMAADIPIKAEDYHALKLVNNGTIEINGAAIPTAGSAAARNYGMKVINNGTIAKNGDDIVNNVINNGTIKLNGINGVGVYVLSTNVQQTGIDDATATLTSDSHVIVSSSAQTDKLIRNYGVWVEGHPDETHRARAFIDGTIDLTGDGAVGVYVRDGGYASVTENANPTFVTGKRQIAFYVYGAGSEIENSAQNMEVNADQSNLFRMDGGASFYGHGENLTASGEDSVIIEGSGADINGRQTTIETRDAHLTVNKKGATAVFINGGAIGQISAEDQLERKIYLTGEGAIGGIVDGRYHMIDSSYSNEEYSSTKLTNYADITTNAKNVTGFITRNSALLVNRGTIDMTNGINATGIHVIEGGRLENYENISVANGIGLHIEGLAGRDTQANIVNTGKITVNDGIAGIYLEKNAFVNASGNQGEINVFGSAHGVLLNSDAKGIILGGDKITVGTGTGNGVENNIISTDPDFAAPIAFKGSVINVGGSGSGIRTAVGLVTGYVDENETLRASTVTINVGANGVGYDFRNAQLNDAILNSNAIIGSGYTINVTGNATGIRTNTTGIVKNYATVTMDSNATGSGWLAGTSSSSENAGTIQSDTENALLVNLTNRSSNSPDGTKFTNSGRLLAKADDVLAVKGSQNGDTLVFTNPLSEVRGLVQAGDGKDNLIWSGGIWSGGFDMGGGDGDQATIANIADTGRFKHALAGNGNDKELTLSRSIIKGGSFAADDLARGVNFGDNWRKIKLADGAKLTLTDDIKSRDNLDFLIENNSVLAINHNDYQGNNSAPTIFSESALRASSKVILTNGGIIDMGDTTNDNITDKLIVKGDYVGNNGGIRLNSDLNGDGAASDRLVIDGGTASGKTKLYIDDLIFGRLSKKTAYEGIKVVDAINGATTGEDSFVIGSGWGRGYQRDDGVMAVAGSDTAYAYLLKRGAAKKSGNRDVYGDDEFVYDWYLRSPEDTSTPDGGNNGTGTGTGGGDTGGETLPTKPYYGPSVPLYEAYPQVLTSLNRLSTLQQRVGNRFWTDGTDNTVNEVHLSDQASKLIEHSGFWGRMEGSTGKVTPSHSPTDEHYDLDLWRMQSGIDGALVENANGILIGSLSGHFGRAEASVRSDDGHGKVEADGYGIGAAATWYGFNGSYVDLQSQATWYETDFNSKNFTRSDTKNENGFGYALSAEAGHRLKLTETWDITPQIQLSYSSIDFDSFRDGLSTKVSLKDGDSLEGRAGLAFSRDKTWISDSGDRRRALLYGIGNLYYEFLDGTKVNVSGTSFRNENEDLQAGLGLGGSYNWNNDNWSLYGETNIRGAFKNVSDNYSFGGTVGLRIKF